MSTSRFFLFLFFFGILFSLTTAFCLLSPLLAATAPSSKSINLRLSPVPMTTLRVCYLERVGKASFHACTWKHIRRKLHFLPFLSFPSLLLQYKYQKGNFVVTFYEGKDETNQSCTFCHFWRRILWSKEQLENNVKEAWNFPREIQFSDLWELARRNNCFSCIYISFKVFKVLRIIFLNMICWIVNGNPVSLRNYRFNYTIKLIVDINFITITYNLETK